MSIDACLSHTRTDWCTPKPLFDQLNDEFGFTLDLCADDENHLCDRYCTAENDGLLADITDEIVYCNPPYGRKTLPAFIRKCATGGARVAVMLIPARTDTRAFHEYIWGKAEVRFIQGRLRFSGHDQNAPFPSMIVVFRRDE